MARSVLAVLSSTWLQRADNARKLSEKHLLPIARSAGAPLSPGRSAVKLRDQTGRMVVDLAAKAVEIDGMLFLKSVVCAPFLFTLARDNELVVCLFEGAPSFMRCVVFGVSESELADLEVADPYLRLLALTFPR